MYQITHLFTHLRKFVPNIVSPLLKHRNERYHTGGLMRRGDYMRRCLYVEQRKCQGKSGLICGRAYTRGGGGGGYSRRNTVLPD